MRSPKAPHRRAVIFRSHGLLQIKQGTLRFPCAGCRQLPFCGLAIWGHLAFGKMYEKMSAVEEEANQLYDQLTPCEREGSNIKGLARIYFENSFIVNNINIVQGKEKIFVSMPSYKTKQVDEQGKPIYQDVCYPVTKDFREKLYNEIISEYEKAKDKSNKKARESAEKHHGNPDKEKDKEATSFR